MRKTIAMILMCLPLLSHAQGNWERPQTEAVTSQKEKTEYQYARYLGNVVPEVNGEVIWEKTFTNAKSAEENYAATLSFLSAMTKEEGQLEESKVSLVNREQHMIVCQFEEWMVFTNKLLSLDRTRFIYTLTAECADHSVKVKIFRIKYWYEELRNGGERYTAEEWITDKWALNKKKTRLSRMSGKFRRKTVDRVEEIFANIKNALMAQ